MTLIDFWRSRQASSVTSIFSLSSPHTRSTGLSARDTQRCFQCLASSYWEDKIWHCQEQRHLHGAASDGPVKCRDCCSILCWAADAIYALCLNRSRHQCCQGSEEVQEVHENGTRIMSLVKNLLFYPDPLPTSNSFTLCRLAYTREHPQNSSIYAKATLLAPPLDNLGHPQHTDQVGKFQTPGTLFPKVQRKIFRVFFLIHL